MALQFEGSNRSCVAWTESLNAAYAAELLAALDGAPLAVDVRNPREREQKHIAGSVSDAAESFD